MHVVYDVDDSCGLYCSNGALLHKFQLPESLCFCKELVAQTLRIPVFETVGQIRVAVLRTGESVKDMFLRHLWDIEDLRKLELRQC